MIFKPILKAIKSFQLVSVLAAYLLGAGLVQYVREMRSWSAFFQGAIFLLLSMLSLELLRLLRYFADFQNWPEGMTLREARHMRFVIVMITATLLTVATILYIDWVMRGIIWQGVVILLILFLFVGVGYYLSQYRDRLKPYQLLLEVLLFVVIPPAMAFFIQSSDLHRLLTLVVICIVPAYLACRILTSLKRFGHDLQYGITTIVTHIGWEKAMILHNALILLTYVLLALAAFLGFPWFLLWPVFLTLPIGLLEIWLMERIRQGFKPLWKVMQFATASVFFITIYLIGFAFWIR